MKQLVLLNKITLLTVYEVLEMVPYYQRVYRSSLQPQSDEEIISPKN
jgi:hypothetical protein